MRDPDRRGLNSGWLRGCQARNSHQCAANYPGPGPVLRARRPGGQYGWLLLETGVTRLLPDSEAQSRIMFKFHGNFDRGRRARAERPLAGRSRMARDPESEARVEIIAESTPAGAGKDSSLPCAAAQHASLALSFVHAFKRIDGLRLPAGGRKPVKSVPTSHPPPSRRIRARRLPDRPSCTLCGGDGAACAATAAVCWYSECCLCCCCCCFAGYELLEQRATR
jgi:hypothetical protein